MKSLADALGAWAPHDRDAAALDPVVLLAAGWPEIVGEDVARHSRPSRLADGVLTVATRSSAWGQELSFLQSRILEAVRARFPTTTVRELRFRVGTVRPAGTRPPASERVSPRRERPPAEEGPPPATALEAVARFRARVEGRRRAQTARGWKECSQCGALVAPAGSSPSAATTCIACVNAGAQTRSAAVARLLFEAPWLGFEATAALVEGLTRREYESIRSTLLSRWWDTLGKAVKAKRISHDGRERSIASSYVLLKSKLAPEEIRPATVRDVLGDALHDLIYGTETHRETHVEQ
ncbi:MAG: DUF721 domain-containing protein [Candidatus Eremiobacteraeota bacterium]|nr:DUF721 domain-containing protein [Candidatus Eremiobacteraeota bacterium]